MLKGLVVDGIFSWGYSIRAAYTSAASQSYPLPPPTTLVGALAAAYARIKKLPEVSVRNNEIYSRVADILSDVLWATIRIPKYAIMHSDLSRLARAHYLRATHRRDASKWFGVSSLGKVYSNSPFRITYIVRQDTKLPLEVLGRCIISLGSKEGLVHIKDVRVVKAEVIKERHDIKTPYYTLRKLIIDYDEGTGTIVKMPPYPPPQSYYRVRNVSGITRVHDDYVAPLMEGPVLTGRNIRVLEVSENALVLKLVVNNDVEYIIAPR